MTAKFTPGPWTSRPSEPGAERHMLGGKTDAIDADSWGMLALVATHSDMRSAQEQGKANAHLIRSAPSLYAALEAVEWRGPNVRGTFEDACPQCHGVKSDGHAKDCTLNAALRLARNEGESK